MTQKFPIPALTLTEIKEKGFKPVWAPESKGETPTVSNEPLPEFKGQVQLKTDIVTNTKLVVDVPGKEFETEITHLRGPLGQEVEFIVSDTISKPWDWKAEEAQNAKQARSLAKFFLALIAGLIVATVISVLLK